MFLISLGPLEDRDIFVVNLSKERVLSFYSFSEKHLYLESESHMMENGDWFKGTINLRSIFLILFSANWTIIQCRVHHCPSRSADRKNRVPTKLPQHSPLLSLRTPSLSPRLELSTCSTQGIRPFFSFETQTRTVHQLGQKLFHDRWTVPGTIGKRCRGQ